MLVARKLVPALSLSHGPRSPSNRPAPLLLAHFEPHLADRRSILDTLGAQRDTATAETNYERECGGGGDDGDQSIAGSKFMRNTGHTNGHIARDLEQPERYGERESKEQHHRLRLPITSGIKLLPASVVAATVAEPRL